MHHDVTVMDIDQLGRYVRLAFTGKRDEEFLPLAFWIDAYSSHHRGSGNGRTPDSAGLFFGELHGFVYKIVTKHPEMNESWYDYPVNADYLDNFRQIFTEIAQECLQKEDPDETTRQLASFLVETAEGVAGSYYGDTPYDQLAPFFDPAKQIVEDPHYQDLFTDEDIWALTPWWESR